MMKKTILYLIPLTFTLVACGESSNVKLLQSPIYKSTQKITQTTAPLIFQVDPGGHKDLIKDVAFTPDGRYLVSASNDKVIRVWDIELNSSQSSGGRNF